MLRDRVEDLEGQRLLKMLLVGILQVLNVVVLLAVLEHGQLSVKVLVPLIQGQIVCAGLLNQEDSELVAILLNHSVGLGSIELGTETLLLHLVGEVSVNHLVDQSALGIAGGSGKRVKNSLLEGAFFEFQSGFGRNAHLLFVGVERLVILEELFIFLLVEGKQLLGLLLVISDVDIFHLLFNLLSVDIIQVLLYFVFVLLLLVQITGLQGQSLLDFDDFEL